MKGDFYGSKKISGRGVNLCCNYYLVGATIGRTAGQDFWRTGDGGHGPGNPGLLYFLDPDACGGGQVANRLRAQLVHGGLQDWLADLILLPGIPYTYGWNQPGREKAKKLGISPFTYWDLLTT